MVAPTTKTFTIVYHKTSSSSISDLTGTKWYFNSTVDISSRFTYYINFTSDNKNCSYLQAATIELEYESYVAGSLDKYDNFSWHKETYRTIEITGGTDATNSELIAWLEANATQQVDTSITIALTESGVYKARVCAAGYSPSEYSNSITYPSSPVITDLTGTSWLWNNEINHASTAATSFAINFISNNTNYTYIKFGGTSGSIRYSENGTSYVEVYNSGQEPPFIAGWTDNAYKTIEITSGTDATNSDLITFLQANATLRVNLISFKVYYQGGTTTYQAEEGMT